MIFWPILSITSDRNYIIHGIDRHRRAIEANYQWRSCYTSASLSLQNATKFQLLLLPSPCNLWGHPVGQRYPFPPLEKVTSAPIKVSFKMVLNSKVLLSKREFHSNFSLCRYFSLLLTKLTGLQVLPLACSKSRN